MLKVNLYIILGFVSLGSALAKADQSDFERGYDAGLKACSPQTTAVLCSGPSINEAGVKYSAFAATGRTKAEAMLKFDPAYLTALKNIFNEDVPCRDLN